MGSEFAAGQVTTDTTIGLHHDLRYLGLNVKQKLYLFGDNSAVITNGTISHSQLQKRHNTLAYHRVREAIADKVMALYHIPGGINPADILSKHWGYQQIWPALRAIMFWQGDTMDLITEQSKE